MYYVILSEKGLFRPSGMNLFHEFLVELVKWTFLNYLNKHVYIHGNYMYHSIFFISQLIKYIGKMLKSKAL